MKKRYRILTVLMLLFCLGSLTFSVDTLAAEPITAETEKLPEDSQAEEQSVIEEEAVTETEATESLQTETEAAMAPEEEKEPFREKLSRWLKALLPDSREAWLSWIRQWILPNMIRGIITGMVICLVELPVMRKIKRGARSFQKATDGVTETKEEVARCKLQLAEAEQRMSDTTEQMRCQLQAYGELMADVRRILCLGFGNNDDLVKKGIAAKIMKIEKKIQEERDREENE